MEMHLESRCRQTVSIGGAASAIEPWSVSFAKGERIWTESSYKYEPSQIIEMGRRAGFASGEQWIDEDARFALTLLTADR
jgi:uncharacterized SAM-dependent methyltransferase